MTVHRFIPAGEKHGTKTACGIRVHPDAWRETTLNGEVLVARVVDDVTNVRASEKGRPFDCSRCRRVLEIRHSNTMHPPQACE